MTEDDVPIAAFAEQYQLDGIRLVEQIPVTGRNRSLILADDQSTRYVARCYLRNRDPERIGFQLAFQDHLREAGLPVPAIIPIRAGAPVATIDGALWVVFEYVAGSAHAPGDRREVRSAARRLDAFHRAGQSFSGKVVQDDTIPDLRRWWIHGAEDVDELRRMFARRGVDDELDFLADWQARLVRELPLDLVDQLPTAWLHSDYHGRNLAFVDGEVVGVFDFDVVHHGWRLDDVARALFYFAGPDGAVINSELADSFTAAFELAEAERIALPGFVAAVHARNAPRYRVREREGSDPTVALRQHVARMSSLL